MADATYHLVSFDDLNGWAGDDHRAALAAFCHTAGQITDPHWQAICHLAPTSTDPRGFFELYFQPVLVDCGQSPLFTGYFEPCYDGSLQADGRYTHPVYAPPRDLHRKTPHASRRQIDLDGALAGQGLELAWLADRMDAFFLQVQGSGRLRLPDGGVLRLGFAGKNGHPYTSIGQVMIARGLADPATLTAQVIRDWVAQNPMQGRDLLLCNDSYVFFTILHGLDETMGPLGTMKKPLIAGRSIAVDPAFVPLGAPVWLESAAPDPQRRLMVAHDTGSAIKGAQRADIFTGTGDAAGAQAGHLRHSGRMITLLPRAVAQQLAGQA